MIEMAIIAMIVSSVTLRVAGNVAVDGFFAARGMESPRLAGARKRRPRGAASAYWSEVWADTWTGWSAKRAARKAGQPSTPRPRGAATTFLAGWWQDRTRAARKSWNDEWTRLDEKRREKASRPRPGQQTVPGEVVPNQDETENIVRPDDSVRDCRNCTNRHWYDQYCLIVTDDPWIGEGPNTQDDSRPQDEDRPGPEPTSVPDKDETAVPDFMCLSCGTRPALPSKLWCATCRDRQEQRNQRHGDEHRSNETDRIFRSWGRSDRLRWDTCPRCNEEMYLGPNGVCSVCQFELWHPNPESAPDSDRTTEPSSPVMPTTEGTTTMTTTTGEVTGLDTAIRFCEDSARGYQAQSHEIELAKASLNAAEATAVAGPLAVAMEMTEAAAKAMKEAEMELRKQLPIAELYRANPGAATKDFMLQG